MMFLLFSGYVVRSLESMKWGQAKEKISRNFKDRSLEPIIGGSLVLENELEPFYKTERASSSDVFIVQWLCS